MTTTKRSTKRSAKKTSKRQSVKRSAKQSAKKVSKRRSKKRSKKMSAKRMLKRSVKKSRKMKGGCDDHQEGGARPRHFKSVKKVYSRKSCPKGSISRKSYTKKSGLKIKSGCVKSKALRSHGSTPKVFLPALKSGTLSKSGYHVHNADRTRHSALIKAHAKYGASTVIKKLNAVRVLTKNTNPIVSKIYKKDIAYVQGL